ncbi:MAG: GNAT family N-acetyltransferase [Thermoflexales bacterium]|nr:GNAT family N-acetyltransferase [Thermoflexales bacterium]
MIELKPATPVDAAELTDVQTHTFDEDTRAHGQGERGGPPGYDSVAWQIEMMQHCQYFKIVDDQHIIGGAIVFRVRPGDYKLGRIYLDPEFQNRGLGSSVMQLIEQQFPTAERWTLDTPHWAKRNHHFYEKLGYVKVREEAIEELGGLRLFFYEKEIERGA